MSYPYFILQNIRWLSVGFLLCLTSSYGQTFFISIFAGDIRAEFGLSNGAWGGIYSMGTTASAAVMIWAGTLTDHFRVRVLAPIILVSLSCACLAMANVPSATFLIFVIFALRFTGQGMTSQVAMVAMARWFQATRGRALAVATLGFAAGNAVLPIIFVSLMVYFGWRQLWVFAAALAVLLIPLLIWLLREERTPQSISKSQFAAGMNGLHWTRVQMLRHWLFWLCVPMIMGPPAWGTALFFQQVHLAEVKGWALFDYVSLYPWLTISSVTSTFLTGMAVDKWGPGRVLPLLAIPFALGFVIVALSGSLLTAGIGLVICGIGMGSQGTAIGAFWAEYYGTRHIGSIKATASGAMVLGSAIGPGVSGYLIDFGINFPTQLFAYAVYFCATGLLLTVGTYRARQLLPLAA